MLYYVPFTKTRLLIERLTKKEEETIRTLWKLKKAPLQYRFHPGKKAGGKVLCRT